MLKLTLIAALLAIAQPDSTGLSADGKSFIEVSSKQEIEQTAIAVLKEVLSQDADADSIRFWISMESLGQGVREQYMLVFNADRSGVEMIGPIKRERGIVKMLGIHPTVKITSF